VDRSRAEPGADIQTAHPFDWSNSFAAEMESNIAFTQDLRNDHKKESSIKRNFKLFVLVLERFSKWKRFFSVQFSTILELRCHDDLQVMNEKRRNLVFYTTYRPLDVEFNQVKKLKKFQTDRSL
jgi:hypothetical protein